MSLQKKFTILIISRLAISSEMKKKFVFLMVDDEQRKNKLFHLFKAQSVLLQNKVDIKKF